MPKKHLDKVFKNLGLTTRTQTDTEKAWASVAEHLTSKTQDHLKSVETSISVALSNSSNLNQFMFYEMNGPKFKRLAKTQAILTRLMERITDTYSFIITLAEMMKSGHLTREGLNFGIGRICDKIDSIAEQANAEYQQLMI